MKSIVKHFQFILILLICIGLNTEISGQNPFVDLSTPAETLIKRVNTVGESLSQSDELYFIASDKLNKTFNSVKWEDQILSMKYIRHTPISDAANWFYFISVKTKNTSTPFYIYYDPANTVWGTYAKVDNPNFPEEFKEYIKAYEEELKNSRRYIQLSGNEKRDLAGKYSPVIEERVKALVNDTLLPEFIKSTEDFLQKASENDDLKKFGYTKELLKAKWTNSEAYIEHINYLKRVHRDARNYRDVWTVLFQCFVEGRLHKYPDNELEAVEHSVNAYRSIISKENRDMEYVQENWLNGIIARIDKRTESEEEFNTELSKYRTIKEAYDNANEEINSVLLKKYGYSTVDQSYTNNECDIQKDKKNENIFKLIQALSYYYYGALRMNEEYWKSQYSNRLVNIDYSGNPDNMDEIIEFMKSKSSEEDFFFDTQGVSIAIRLMKDAQIFFESDLERTSEFKLIHNEIENIFADKKRLKSVNKFLSEPKSISDIREILTLEHNTLWYQMGEVSSMN